MLVAGLALAVGTPILLSWNHDKAERQRAKGVRVDAAIRGPTLQIWVDPQHPGAFVTKDGNTDDANLATGYLLLPAGLLTLLGGLGIWSATGTRSVRHRGRRRA